MKEIDVNNWERLKNYEWFSNFSDSTYGMNVKMDVTKLVKHVKEKKESFFIDLLFIVLNGLNSVDEMRIRLVNNKPVIYDDINPAFTVSHMFVDSYPLATVFNNIQDLLNRVNEVLK